ncbi:MAG: TetR/AcrR family transcriptional regulator [Methylococcales bacterium]|jgi:TetR/AcrR family transcriptional regulator, transcriptional repressor for nem operon|nr:TetR/AcrR family transcriptional regulator [Methylococcales bacterium]MBT7443615.1 TetR/AcrR family transcriptional regulator [Methylococcales bacterium]
MGRTSDAKERILDSAQSLIYARSYADVGVQEICEKAGVKKGSFYHFFPSKSDLTLAVLEQYWAQFQTHILNPAFNNDIPPLKRFARFQNLVFEFHKQSKVDTGKLCGCPYGNLASELSTQDDHIRLKVKHIFSEIILYFKNNLKQASEAGECDCVDIDTTSRALFAYIEGIVILAKTENDPNVLKELSPHFYNLIH